MTRMSLAAPKSPVERGNAIVLLARLTRAAMKAGTVQVATVMGGVQNNVIPAEAQRRAGTRIRLNFDLGPGSA